MGAFDYLEKISSFRGQFNAACAAYTCTEAFQQEVSGILKNVSVDNADVAVRNLKEILTNYPDQAAQELGHFNGDIKLPGTNDGTVRTALVNFTKPMLKVLS